MLPLDLKNKQFGSLLALESTNLRKHGHVVWKCKCLICNKIVYLPTSYLTSSDSQSCGCIKKEMEKVNLRKKYDDKRVKGVAMHLYTDKVRSDSRTGYKGVSKYLTRVSKSDRYRACLTLQGVKYYKSGFTNQEEAYQAYLDLKKEHLPKYDEG